MLVGTGTPPAPDILLVVGSDAGVDRTAGRTRISGATDLHRLLGKAEPVHRLQITGNFFRQARRPDLTRYRCLVNLITEAETNAQVLAVLGKIARDFPGKLINPPGAVLQSTRDQVARRLAGIPGLHVPKVLRLRSADPKAVTKAVEQAGFEFPALLRAAGTHTGRFVGRFGSLAELLPAIPAAGEHLLTEYVDFQSPDGLYRKHRMFFIGGRQILRHKLIADDWNVHGKYHLQFMGPRPDLLAEERKMMARPDGAFPAEIRATLLAVRERMPLDFFGMDFGILGDGRVLLFEANATMNFFPFRREPQFAFLLDVVPHAQAALRELLGLEWRPLAPVPRAPPWTG